MKFLNSWTISLDKLPAYTAFKANYEMKLDATLLNAIYHSDNPNFTADRKQLLLPILEKINKKTGILKVKHNQRYDVGRFYPNNSISPICVSRHIKHTLFHHLNWIDLDMVKGHPSILYYIALKNGRELKAFKKYLDNPTAVFDKLKSYYSTEESQLSDDNIKDIFNIAIYGGGHNTWLSQMGNEKIDVSTTIPHPDVVEFLNECKILIDLVYLNNPLLVEKVKGNLTDEYSIKTRTMSYWCGTIENHIVYNCYRLLEKRGIANKQNCALEYDGLCLKRTASHTDEFLESILNDINDKIFKETGLAVKMKWKQYKEEYVHQDIIDSLSNENVCEEKPIVEYNTFEKVCETFEQTTCKITNKSIFVKHNNNRIIVMSKQQLKTSYEHMTYDIVKQNENGDDEVVSGNFINDWLINNPNQRRYEDIGCYPTGLNCPENIFNSWIPFDMEFVTDYMHKQEELDIILNHIKILCGNSDDVFDYFIKWIAQMIQYPAVKSICPTLISKEGAGKTTLIQLFTKMLGTEKVFETATPSRDIWGDFNGRMANTFLVNLNELSKRETTESEGRIKALITDPKLTINNKGVSQYDIDSFHRFIITTNNEEPVNTTKDDRRKLIIRSSDEKIGDKDYFNQIYKYLDDVNVIKTCYEYFKSIEGINDFNKIPMPSTSYQQNLKELSRSPIELWLENLCYENWDSEEVEMLGSEAYGCFHKFCQERGIEFQMNAVKLGVRIKNMGINGIEKGKHTKKGETKLYKIQELKKHYNLGTILLLHSKDDNELDENNS
jgi:hypothetical protein